MCLAVGFLFAIVVSCSPSDNSVRPLSDLQSKPISDSKNYLVQSGDILEVSVWGETQLSGQKTVRDDGKFVMPLVHEVQAEGLTVTKISEDITRRLQEYIPNVSVLVSLFQTAPIRYYLSGQFVKPGEYKSKGKITLLQAIASGSNFTPLADESSIMLIRKTSQGEIRYELDYNLVVEGRQPNPELRTGDVIAVR